MVIILAFIAIILFIAFCYNIMISKRNSVLNVESTVDALLKKRYDLIPNLCKVVESYASYEKQVFSEVARARSEFFALNSMKEKLFLDSDVSIKLNTIFALSENYPDLKANKNFLHLQASMVEVEEQISAGRRAYNSAVLDYNTFVSTFPFNLIAKLFGYKNIDFFSY